MSDYEVGQILYLVMRSKPQVIPAKVTEHIMRKTLSGIENSYVLLLPGGKTTQMENLDADFFKSSEATEKFMLERANEKIREMISWCETRISTEFQQLPEDNVQPPEEDQKIDLIDLGGGVIGRLKTTGNT